MSVEALPGARGRTGSDWIADRDGYTEANTRLVHHEVVIEKPRKRKASSRQKPANLPMMETDQWEFLIQHGTVINADSTVQADVLIEGEKIAAVVRESSHGSDTRS